mmetsp:Transcript_39230/g.82501  ORF Transcript_39230/g.82501 Transcript_39230/m.82501 type:complete len:265 (+) Transcript_39230:2483-3277(+)
MSSNSITTMTYPSSIMIYLLLSIIFAFAPIQEAEAWTPPPQKSPISSLPQQSPSVKKNDVPSSPSPMEVEVPSPSSSSSRKNFLRRMLIDTTSAASSLLLINSNSQQPANAAPPFAIMEEELGYFPVTDERTGQTLMVPSRPKRHSTDQAIELAQYLSSQKTIMYGAFWCPHCSRQKELFGKEAWALITYVECSPKGYRGQYAACLAKGVDGYPTWKFGNGKEQGGEMELVDIAKMSGFLKKKGASFDAGLETGVPPLGGGSCK